MDNASPLQQRKLLQEVARQTLRMLKHHKKVWINTHGNGVHFLHVRIDIRPRYYRTKNSVICSLTKR